MPAIHPGAVLREDVLPALGMSDQLAKIPTLQVARKVMQAA